MRVVSIIDTARDSGPAGQKVEIAESYCDRLVGLMGRQCFETGQGLLLRPCSGVHTLFLRMDIDVVHLDRRMRVLAVVKKMRPWRIGRLGLRTRMVLELPAGDAAKFNIQTGDLLAITSPDPGAGSEGGKA